MSLMNCMFTVRWSDENNKPLSDNSDYNFVWLEAGR